MALYNSKLVFPQLPKCGLGIIECIQYGDFISDLTCHDLMLPLGVLLEAIPVP